MSHVFSCKFYEIFKKTDFHHEQPVVIDTSMSRQVVTSITKKKIRNFNQTLITRKEVFNIISY